MTGAATSITANSQGFVSVRQLAVEFGENRSALRKWLLRHDFSLGRKIVLADNRRRSDRAVTVLTLREANRARFIKRHGVIVQQATP